MSFSAPSRAFAVVVSLATASCAGETLHVGDDTPAPSSITPAILARCPDPAETTSRLPDDVNAASSMLEGRWIRCRGYGVGILYSAGFDLRHREGMRYGLETSPDGLVRSDVADRRGKFSAFGSSISFKFESGLPADTLVVLFDASGTKMTAVYSDYDGPVEVAYVHE